MNAIVELDEAIEAKIALEHFFGRFEIWFVFVIGGFEDCQ